MRQPDSVVYRRAIADEIRVLMLRKRVKQETLAKAVGISQPTLSKKLNGHVAWDSDVLFNIADYLDVPITDLMPISRGYLQDAGSEVELLCLASA